MSTTIWRFTDGRGGHDAQSLGLVRALRRRTNVCVIDVPVRHGPQGLWLWLSGRYPRGAELPAPDLLLGAGHSSHFHLLAARRRWGGRIILCMKPTLPLSWFDLCLIPEHDSPPRRDNVLATVGVLGCVRRSADHDPDTGLIVLGGPSRHYHWNDDQLVEQVDALIEARPLRRWLLGTSPRTPQSLLRRLAGRRDVEYFPHPCADREALAGYMAEAGEVWVSEDSASMLYEALSSGARVGVLQVPRKAIGRVAAGVEALRQRGWLAAPGRWHAAGGASPPLDEAGRCADWLRQRWLNDR